MTKQRFYVGLDVGKETIVMALPGRKSQSFAFTVAGVKAMVQRVRKDSLDQVIGFCMEATGVYSEALAIQLVIIPEVVVSIVNPAQIAAFAKAQLRRTKTDQVDAQVILAFAQSQNPRPWKPASKALRQLRQLIIQRDALMDMLQQCRNRHHAQEYIPDLLAEVKKSQRAIERKLETEIGRIDKAITKMCQENPEVKETIQLLASIVGVATNSASHILSYGQTSLTDRPTRQLTAHAGLAPAQKQSGTSVRGKSHIAKQGNSRLRKALYMPTLVGIRYNPVLKAKYQALIAKGKPKKVALVACMRKLLIIIHAILITKKPFNPAINQLT
ncbi:MAG: IS110 family transposase [candidate division Zixibacteria bacterium]|nr:IS110 family transposase [candidate division Zixibacteria bacterium]